MKKIFYSLVALAALASCTKTEAVYVEDNTEIKIKPATAIATKANVLAAIDGTEYPVKENFDVYAYWNEAGAGSNFTEGTVYLGLNNQAVEFKNKGNYWGGVTTYFWPKNGSLRFAAYSPSSVDMLHTLATDTYTVDGYTQKSNTAETWDLLVAPTSQSYTAMTAAENVSVVFEHALSWITVKVVAKDADAAKAFDIKKVTINDVNTVADFAAAMTDGIQYEEWSNQGTPAAYVIYEGSQAVTETATDIETTKNGTIVIPQPTTTITVDYKQNALEGTPALDNQQVTVDLVLDANDTPWEPGKHYVYTLVFGLDEILINPDVVDWDDVNAGQISTDPIQVATTAEFVEAIEKGGQVSLQANINLDEVSTKAAAAGVVLNKDVVIEGNGYTVTTTAVRAFQIINAKDVTIKNLNLVARGERGFQLQTDGQTLVLDNVTAVSNNYTLNITSNGTNATVTVNNSDLKGLNTVNVWGENANVTINNTTLRTVDNATEGYTTVCNNAENGVITVNGGEVVITGTHPEDTHAGAVNANGAEVVFNGTVGNCEVEGHSFAINYGEYRYTFPTFASALEAAQAGEIIVMIQDVTTETYFNVTKSITLDLNGNTLTAAKEGSEVDAIRVKGTSELIITGNGTINASYDCVVAMNDSKVTIENGTFTAPTEVIYAQNNGQVVINGGSYKAEEPYNGVYYTLNILDKYRATASILVNGGSFYMFNPGANAAEGNPTNFLAAGKTVSQDGDWFVVE